MPRGRPRNFDEDKALNGAMLLFWEKGLSATSLDDLASAMKMNRPSIYNAFGNKDAIYRKALARFCGQLDHGLEATLGSDLPLQDAVRAFYRQAISVYCGTNPAMGCLMICTAPGEAFSHPEVGTDLKDLINRLDAGFAARLEQAKQGGEIHEDADAALTASLLQATLQTIALRARAGTPKSELLSIGDYAVEKLLR